MHISIVHLNISKKYILFITASMHDMKLQLTGDMKSNNHYQERILRTIEKGTRILTSCAGEFFCPKLQQS